VKVKECRDDIVLEPHHVYSTLLCLVYFIQNIKKKKKKRKGTLPTLSIDPYYISSSARPITLQTT